MEKQEIKIKEHRTHDLTLYTIGPSLEEKAKSVLYFSLSGYDSLMTPPFSTPATLLVKQGYRVISVTLPGHEENQKPMNIRQIWGKDPSLLREFLLKLETSINEIKNQFVGKVAAIGLSRGAFIATHLAARLNIIDKVLGFAPLTFLEDIPSMDLIHLAEKIQPTKVRYSIGNRDTLVDTDRVRNTINTFIDSLNAKGRQDSNISLSIYPSVGKDGHGTPPSIFKEGIDWLIGRSNET